MKRAVSRFTGLAIVVAMVLLALTGMAQAKSLYVITDINAYPTPIRAYNVNPDGTLTFQAEYPLSGTQDAVGLAVDTATNTLFITSEGSNIIQLVDAKTMTGIGSATAPGAFDLAGIVVDEAKKLIYAVDRYSSNLYVYKWDAANKTLNLEQQVTLANVGGQGAFGIALDQTRGLLYIANYNYGLAAAVAIENPFVISYYETGSWDQAGTVELAGPAIGIAVDPFREFLYSGAGWAGYSMLDYYDLQTGNKAGIDLGYGSGAMGIVVDEETGLVYITTGYEGDELRVYRYNADTSSLELVQNLGVIGGAPTGLAIGAGFNPLNLDKSADAAAVAPGSRLTYTLSFDNLNNPNAVHNVILTDNLPPETVFVSASEGGVFDLAHHAVTWNIGDLAAGAPTRSVQVVVRVRPSATPGTFIRNSATIDSDDTPPTTKSLETRVKAKKNFFLTFPAEGFDAYSAPVICVLDHSVFETKPVKFYVPDGKVKAFNGETAESVYGANKLEGFWDGYKNSSGSDFLAGVLNYVHGPFLYYDGHSGYDYQVPKRTRILATARGELYIAKNDPVNGGGWEGYKTFYIKHRVTIGNRTVEYYTWYLYVNLKKSIRDEVLANGFVRVRKGQVIGRTYNDWFHVDFRRQGIGNSRIFDPYKARLWEAAE